MQLHVTQEELQTDLEIQKSTMEHRSPPETEEISTLGVTGNACF